MNHPNSRIFTMLMYLTDQVSKDSGGKNLLFILQQCNHKIILFACYLCYEVLCCAIP